MLRRPVSQEEEHRVGEFAALDNDGDSGHTHTHTQRERERGRSGLLLFGTGRRVGMKVGMERTMATMGTHIDVRKCNFSLSASSFAR